MKRTPLLLVTGLALLGQDYFPLDTGNVWTYAGTGSRAGQVMQVEVTGQMRDYAVVRGLLAGDVYLRSDGAGGVYAYDVATGRESRWWWFTGAEGAPYDSSVSCCGRATVSARTIDYKGPVGEFTYALEMRYPGVFQVGIDRDVFVPGLGLASRTIATGGPTYGGWELTYARVGGVYLLTGPEVSFSLSMLPPATALIRMRVARMEPLEVTFSSGQVYEIIVRNASGAVVYRWSDGKGFTQALRTVKFSGETNWVAPVGLVLPSGRYTAEAYLVTVGPRAYAATVEFDVR